MNQNDVVRKLAVNAQSVDDTPLFSIYSMGTRTSHKFIIVSAEANFDERSFIQVQDVRTGIRWRLRVSFLLRIRLQQYGANKDMTNIEDLYGHYINIYRESPLSRFHISITSY